jgi:hypothetical protein
MISPVRSVARFPRTSFRIRLPWAREGELVNQLKYLVDEADGDGLGKWSTTIAADGKGEQDFSNYGF